MERLRQDVRFGIRMLFKHPGLSIISIVTFGLGIALTTTVFTIVNGILFKGLPQEDSYRIMALRRTNPARNVTRMSVSVHDFVDWQQQQTVFETLGGYNTTAVNLSWKEGKPERFLAARFTADMFKTLGVRPTLGRGFREGEDRPGAEPVIVIGHRIWRDRYNSSPDVLGQALWASGVSRTIVGVMPEDFAFPHLQQAWIPLEIDPAASKRGEGPSFQVIGRIRKGVSLEEANTQMSAIAERLAQEYPGSNEGVGAAVLPYVKDFFGTDAFLTIAIMLGAAIAVLLIACMNVANLLLARASQRTREVAVRTAVGASRGRLVTQLLTEVMVLAVLGGFLGFGLGEAGVRWFEAAVSIDPPPYWITFELDYRVMLFLTAMIFIASLFSGLLPALQASRTDVVDALKDEGRGLSSFRMGRFTGILVVAEVAFSCCLLVVSGLMIKSIVKLNTVNMPFATKNIFTARLDLPQLEYPDETRRIQFYEQLLPRLEAIPGVEAATLSDGLPASGNGTVFFEVEGQVYEQENNIPSAREGIVTPGYFRTFQTEVLQGRAFKTKDTSASLPVAVVNASFARTYFPDGDVLGKRIRKGKRDTSADWLTIVGIVPDMLMQGIGNADASPAGFYIPIAQSNVTGGVRIAMRTRDRPMERTDDVRAAIASIDSNLPIFNVLSMEREIYRATWPYLVFGTLFMSFGIAALFLAVAGLYGVMSFSVTRRTQEMGIRLALGAPRGTLVRLIMRRGLIHIGIGLALGLGMAALTTGPLQDMLYKVEVRDPMVFLSVVAALALSGLLASLIPARRITKIDPMLALTAE